IADQMEKLRDLDPNEVWPSDDLLFHKDDETRVIAYERLYPIAMKAPETRTGILNVLNMAQKAELVFTWNKGECVEYSTKTKGEVRKNLKRLYQTIENAPIVDLDQEITSWDSDQEELDNLEGSSHTRLMSWRLGAGAVKSPAKDWRALFTLGGAIYGQDMGDLSNRAMQRGTSVMLGDVDLSFKRVNEGHVEITDWRITGLKIRKIKARRHYIPSVFSRNRKLGLGFTLLELSTDPWEENRYKTVFAEGEVFTSLVSSRLNLDHLNIALGVGLETPWGTENCFAAMLLNEETLLEIPFRLDGLLTFGDNRQLQTRAMLEYKYFYDFKGDDSASYSKKNLLVGTSFVYRLAEINKAEVLLKGNLEFKDDFSQDATGNRNQQLMLRVGFEINRW
ncbi:hypothetical protein KKA14_06055, partial [bacterium]|nr:hypothetical protein [bacterium]